MHAQLKTFCTSGQIPKSVKSVYFWTYQVAVITLWALNQGRSQAIRRVGSLRTKSGPSNSFYNYGDFKTCMS